MRWRALACGLCLAGCGALPQIKSTESVYRQGQDQTKQYVGESKRGKAAEGDPDGDGGRAQARETKPNEVVTEEVGVQKGDGADWRKYDLRGRPGPVRVKLRWDDPKAELSLDLYDAFGATLAASPGRQRQPEKRIVAQLEAPGLCYVRVAAQSGGSVYTMQLEWKGAPAIASAPALAPVGSDPAPAAPPPAHPRADDPSHPRCRVVQSYRDGDGKLILYLDRGSDAGFRVGMTGTLLVGKEGDAPLEGGSFHITQIIDPQRSIAKASVSKVGGNYRARVDLMRSTP